MISLEDDYSGSRSQFIDIVESENAQESKDEYYSENRSRFIDVDYPQINRNTMTVYWDTYDNQASTVVVLPPSPLAVERGFKEKPRKTFSFNVIINNLFENPDGRMTTTQRAFIVIYTAYEAYRTIISSYLIVFVPQKCGRYSCTIAQNFTPVDGLELAAISMNTFMAFYFFALFYVERERETAVNLYLVSDKKSPTNKEYLMGMINSMDTLPKRKILMLNNLYRRCAQSILVAFIANIVISCIVIYKNYLNNTTSTVFITNSLFAINRIYKALKITSSGEYNIYSAYRADFMLYNRDRSSWLQHETEDLELYADTIYDQLNAPAFA